MHLAEVVQMAMHQPLEKRKYIETGFVQERAPYPTLAMGAAGGIALAGGLYLLSKDNRS